MSAPPSSLVARLEATLARGKDGAPLRLGLASALVQAGRLEDALVHLERALELEPRYAAAWKLLGQCLAGLERTGEAMDAYRSGIEAAREAGHMPRRRWRCSCDAWRRAAPAQVRQKAGESTTSRVKISRRPRSMARERSHLPAGVRLE